MPERKFLAGTGYRYGFNGKENDSETSSQDYGMRIYSPGIGRFLSVDPISSTYAELTPYQFASNSPIVGIDLDGLELQITNYYYNLEVVSGRPKLTLIRYESHQAHDGSWLKNYWAGSGCQENWVLIYKGQRLGFGSSSGTKMIQSAERIAKLESGDKEELRNQERREIAQAVGVTILSKGFNVLGGLFKPNNAAYNASVRSQPTVYNQNSTKLGGRSLIVDENLSPKLVDELTRRGYKVTTFKSGTQDPEIIEFAQKNNAIVVTNNIKDFNTQGITTFKVSENLKKQSEVNTVVGAIDNIGSKAATNPGTVASGQNVSIAENKKND